MPERAAGMGRTRPWRRAAPTGVATGIPGRGRAAATAARTLGAVGLGGDPQGGPRAQKSPRTGEPGLAQVCAPADAREGAAPRPLCCRWPPHTRLGLVSLAPLSPSTHAHPSYTPHAPLYRGLRPEHPRHRGPGSFRHPAAGSGAHDRPPAHCARVHALPLPDQTAAEIPKRALPIANTTSPDRLRAGPAAWRAKESGVFLVPGWWLAAARGALGSPCRAASWGLQFSRTTRLGLGRGTWGSLMSSPRAARRNDL